MNQIYRPGPPPKRTDEQDDPFRYGWRHVRRKQADGTEKVDVVPLSKEDLLYPELGDFVVDDPQHTRDFVYCRGALTTFYKDEPNVVVLGDNPVDFGTAGVRTLGPDILVLFDVPHWRRQTTFHLAEDGGRPVLVLEIVSPSTRDNDLGAKIALYDKVGVQKYVIVDRGPEGQDPARLIGYERTPQGWQPITADAQGRLSLAPVPLLLGTDEANNAWLYDAVTGERLRDHTEAETKAREEEKARKKAEAKAKRAETKARKEAEARKKLEAEAKEAAEAQAALKKQVRELEKQLRQQKGKS